MRFGKRDREPHGSESDDEIFFKVVNEDTGGNEGEKKPESVLQDVGEKAADLPGIFSRRKSRWIRLYGIVKREWGSSLLSSWL